jgi:hypothetical protein
MKVSIVYDSGAAVVWTDPDSLKLLARHLTLAGFSDLAQQCENEATHPAIPNPYTSDNGTVRGPEGCIVVPLYPNDNFFQIIGIVRDVADEVTED